MKSVKPEVYIIGSSHIDDSELNRFLNDIGAGSDSMGWANKEDGVSFLPELYGRMCYRSYTPGLNPNVTKIREESAEYLNNILNVGHESVLEHSTVNFIFHNVSRVVTHELVRHRVGTAISQESLRYVRLDNLNYYVPQCTLNNPELFKVFEETIEYLEKQQLKMAEIAKIDEMSNFAEKKELTSAFRRIAPIGLTTTIGWSANIRTIRHVLELRTSKHAEEEIRVLFALVGKLMLEKFPHLFQDFEVRYEGETDIPIYSKKG